MLIKRPNFTSPEKILCIIPARGGSKGIPRKNLRPLGGRPLLVHSIEAALNSESVERVVVSTDDAEIANVARDSGAEVVTRPPDLSTDTATSESALVHALDCIEQDGYSPELVVFLQCTSPVRRPGDVDRAVETLIERGADSLLSVSPFHRFIWRVEEGEARSVNYDHRSRPRRQDRAPEYVENGSIYVFRPWVLRQFGNRLGGKVALFEMDYWSGFEVDDPEDLDLCAWILTRQNLS